MKSKKIEAYFSKTNPHKQPRYKNKTNSQTGFGFQATMNSSHAQQVHF